MELVIVKLLVDAVIFGMIKIINVSFVMGIDGKCAIVAVEKVM
jgi:hypothetical protein